MKRISWGNFLVWIALIVTTVVFWGAVLLLALSFIPARAHAQTGGFVFSPRESSQPHGEYIVGWNTSGSTIYDGTLVMADTSGATSFPQVAIGKGFKTWTHVTTFGHAQRVLGVMLGNTPGRNWGRILVLGFHPWVKVDATAISPYSLMRPSLISTTNGAMAAFAASDTTTITTPGSSMRRPIIGIFQRYANDDRLRAFVWVNTLGVMGN